MIRNSIKKAGEIISKIIIESTPFFIFLGILNFFSGEYVLLQNFKRLFSEYILPIVLTYNSGKIFEEKFGGTCAVIVMGGMMTLYNFNSFLEPIFIGSLAGVCMSQYKRRINKFAYLGYEMLLNNIGTVLISSLLLLGFIELLPLYTYIQEYFMKILLENLHYIKYIKFVPLFSIIIEPSKIFFLNNIINHGVLSVLGLNQLEKYGKSIFFLMETNPGPGLGILLAYYFTERNKKDKKKVTEIWSNIFIHFIGGIHEVYFPYVLKKLKVIPILIFSGMVGIYIFNKFNAGLIGIASPGSVFLLLLLSPWRDKLAIILGISLSTLISFFLGYFILNNKRKWSFRVEENENKVKKISNEKEELEKKEYIRICVVCDAGMGSSAMGATLLKGKIEKAGLENILVRNSRIDSIPEKIDFVIVHRQLINRIKTIKKWELIVIDDFIDGNFYEEFVSQLKNYRKENKKNNEYILKKSNIQIGLKRVEKEKALRNIGERLYNEGYVERGYINSIFENEISSNMYFEKGIVVVHGNKTGLECIKNNGIVIDQYPYGIDYGNGKIAYLLVGIAAFKSEYIKIISKLPEIIDNAKLIEDPSTITDIEEIYKIFLSLEEVEC